MLEAAIALELTMGEMDFDQSLYFQNKLNASIASPNCHLTQQQRDFLFAKMGFALKKVEIYLDKAQVEFDKMKNYSARKAFTNALAGAIAGIQGGTPASVAISACLAVVAGYAVEATDSYLYALEYLREAERYARCYEDYEIQLWNG